MAGNGIEYFCINRIVTKMAFDRKVKVWEEDIILPTYGVGKPEKNPMFLENRVYQGSSGVVYPHPVIEKILDTKTDKRYHAVFLENDFLKIMVLPELGGRIQMAYDKIKQRHFIYYNRVIKPALVGLTGPWISGGIEFNWPQHHRPSTFDPLDFTTEEHSDGSKTIWVSEVERMFRTKGMAGFRLYPDKAYLEINVKLHNRTFFPQTFLWWANPAVKVNDDYQSVFPPDVHAVYDHGKRDVSEFPIARGIYYKIDYSAGVDISRYKNIPVPTSYMAVKSEYDFMGGYEHDSKGGLLHVANHHVSPGKKQWTWGNSDFGIAWDKNLTDEDGPYIELMTGVFTDNQPDFSWIQPNEERTFTQYFMPYSDLGVVKNATREAMVNLEIRKDNAVLSVYATGLYTDAHFILDCEGENILDRFITLHPAQPIELIVPFKKDHTTGNFHFRLVAKDGSMLVEYKTGEAVDKSVPEPAVAAKDPAAIASSEELFLTGLHIEQYRHATYKATDYYEEALRREPGDARNNNAMGLWNLRRAQFSKAEPYFRTAIATLTQRNPNSIDGEPYFNLGVCLMNLERFDDAIGAFYKSSWNAAFQDNAYLNLARILTRKGNFEEGLQLVGKSLNRNHVSQTGRHLKTIILRKLKRVEEGLAWTTASLQLDPFNFGLLYEDHLLRQSIAQPSGEIVDLLLKLIRGNVHTYIEYALDYAHAGCYEEATDLLSLHLAKATDPHPMALYYLGYFAGRLHDAKAKMAWYKKAAGASPDYCFPNRIEDVSVLQDVIGSNPADAMALYYLGNFWYANRQYREATECWERSAQLNGNFPTVFRNLALAYHNKQRDPQKALSALERSFALNSLDSRVLMELDQLYKKLNRPHQFRLEWLERHLPLTEERDDLYLERVTLYNLIGDFETARHLIDVRKFHPWEGGEGKVIGQYLTCHVELAKKALLGSRYQEALTFLEHTERYPDNLGEGKLYGTQENDINYLKGCAYEGMADLRTARGYYLLATVGLSDPTLAIYYNDQQPDKIFYQGLAWKKLGEQTKANEIFNKLVVFGNAHLNDTIKIDYFAVSLPDLLVFDQDLAQRNKNHCHYLIGLGLLGLNNGKQQEAEVHFDLVLQNDINHIGAILHKKMVRQSVILENQKY